MMKALPQASINWVSFITNTGDYPGGPGQNLGKARHARLLPRGAMPDLLDERQCLTIERMFDADNYRFALPAADFSEIKSLRASNLHQITRLQTCFTWIGRQIDPQRLAIQTTEESRMSVAIRQ